MKKRIFALAAAVGLLLTLSACGDKSETSDSTSDPSAEATASPTATSESQVDLNSYIGSYKNQEYGTQGLDVSMEGDNLRVMAYQPGIVFFDEVVSTQSLQGNQIYIVAEDPATQEHFNVTLTFDGAHIRMTSTSPQLGEDGVYIPGEASDLPLIEEPEEDPRQDNGSQYDYLFTLSDYTREYTYEGPAGDYYVLTLDDAVGGAKLTLFWRGMYLHENTYVADGVIKEIGDNTYTYTFMDGGELHELELHPSTDGGEALYVDGLGPFRSEAYYELYG